MNECERQTLFHLLRRWYTSRQLLQPLDPNIYTSVVFLTNAVTAFSNGYWFYAVLFTLLFKTSIVWRLYPSTLTFVLDKAVLNAVVFCGGYILYTRLPNIHLMWILFIMTTFVATVYLFYYGYITKSYCYDTKKTVAANYHSLLHVIASLGHHLIILA